MQRCLGYVRKGDTLLVSKLDRLARPTVDLYNIVAQLQAKGVEFKVIDEPSIDTTSRTGKLVMGILALIAEFENDIRRERQLDGMAKAKERGVCGVQPKLTEKVVSESLDPGAQSEIAEWPMPISAYSPTGHRWTSRAPARH